MILTFLSVLIILLTPILVPAAIIVGSHLTLERIRPMAVQRKLPRSINLLAAVVWNAAVRAFSPVVTIVTVLMVNDFGGGWIELPSQGLGLVAGFVVFALSQDLAAYLFHRAEHAVPGMWAMHSLHHSDRHFDASTGILHHWGAPLLSSLTTSLPLALLFKTPPADLALWGLMGHHVYLMHANIKWDFGRFWWLLTSPVYHRTHHSALPEHFNCNYASLFPMWDVIFGSARHVELHSLPPVGLGEGSEARSLLDIVFWTSRSKAAPEETVPQRALAAAEANCG